MVCASLNYHNSDKHKWNFLFLTLGLWQQSENGAFTGEFFLSEWKRKKSSGYKDHPASLLCVYYFKKR